jgi:hypothetical protein
MLKVIIITYYRCEFYLFPIYYTWWWCCINLLQSVARYAWYTPAIFIIMRRSLQPTLVRVPCYAPSFIFIYISIYDACNAGYHAWQATPPASVSFQILQQLHATHSRARGQPRLLCSSNYFGPVAWQAMHSATHSMVMPLAAKATHSGKLLCSYAFATHGDTVAQLRMACYAWDLQSKMHASGIAVPRVGGFCSGDGSLLSGWSLG